VEGEEGDRVGLEFCCICLRLSILEPSLIPPAVSMEMMKKLFLSLLEISPVDYRTPVFELPVILLL
jgi:hypothetical protein